MRKTKGSLTRKSHQRKLTSPPNPTGVGDDDQPKRVAG